MENPVSKAWVDSQLVVSLFLFVFCDSDA